MEYNWEPLLGALTLSACVIWAFILFKLWFNWSNGASWGFMGWIFTLVLPIAILLGFY